MIAKHDLYGKIIKTGKRTFIEKEVFEEKFGNSYKYEDLINHKKCDNRWEKIFNFWKDEGFIE